MKCEHCRQQLLPYLYDLLEPAERQELAAHLDACPACRDALTAAQEQQGMLAEAVKESADIVFKAPAKVAAPSASTAPTVALQPKEPTPRRSLFLLNRWAAAAAVLLFLFSGGAVIGWSVYRDNSEKLDASRRAMAKARDDLAKKQDELNQKRGETQKDIREIQKQIDTLFKDWKDEEAKKRKELEEKRAEAMSIRVDGPQNLIVGAKNPYQIEIIENLANQKQPQLPGVMQQNMQARLINQNKDVLYQQPLKVQANNRAQFDVPPDLPVKPGDQIAMEILTEMPDGKLVPMRDNLKLVFPDFVTHLATDRPMYRPGETVRFRSLTLERFSLKPAQQKFHLRYRISGPRNVEIFKQDFGSELVAGDKKDALKGPGGAPLFGLGVGEFALPDNLAEGEYTLTVSEVNERFNDEKRSFLVRRWQAPRLNKEVQFHRSSYGPGELVKIQVRVVPVQGQAAGFGNINVIAKVAVDGMDLQNQNRNIDADGRAEFDFTLPAQIFRGVGVATIECDDGGNRETVVRNIPIVLRDLHVDFYPEGGDLITGVPNRVYFQARTPAGRPADMQGVILDDKKQEIARIQTVTDDKEPGINQGLGAFTFTPKLGRRYTLRIDSPIGIDRPIALPASKANGVALSIPQAVVDNEIKVTLQNAQQPRELLVGAYCRGRMLDHKLVKAPANKPVEVTLKPAADVGGVYRITVFEKLIKKEVNEEQVVFRPLAERLIYRKNTAKVDVAIETDRAVYQPGESVQLRLLAQNEKRDFVPAVAMIAVVDTSVLKLRDEKTARTMPTHFLLTTEIRNPEELEHADFLLGNHPKAALALDLLLGSQGWRRFAEQNPQEFQQRQQNAKQQPVFLNNANTIPQFLDAEKKQLDQLDQNYVPKAIDLQKSLAESERKLALHPQNAVQNENEVAAAQEQINAANQRVREMRVFLTQFGLGGGLLTLLFIGFYLISVGLRKLSEGGNPRPWLVSGLSLLGMLFLISVIGTFALLGEPFMDDFRFNRDKGMAVGMKAAPPMGLGEAPPFPVVGEMELVQPDDINERREPAVDLAGKAQPQPQQRFNAEVQQVDQRIWNNLQNDVPPMPPPAGFFDEKALRQEGNYQAIVQKHLNRRVQVPPAHDPCVVREYAHKHKVEPDQVRRDFAETLCWQPVLVMEDGKAQVNFDLSDSVTRFQVVVLSHTLDGRLGANTAEITAKLPFSVEPKTPIEVTQTDQIGIPVAITNSLTKKLSVETSARVKGLDIQGNAERNLVIEPNQTRRSLVSVKPSITDGVASIRVLGKTAGYTDGVERKFKIVPDGFPVTNSHSGILENQPIEHEINIPADFVPGSLKVQAHFFPSPAAELQGGLEQMLREPVGCFEQSSSSNYPNTLVLQYLKRTRDSNPLVEKRARAMLQSGYQKLTSFECDDADKPGSKRGYEWFGGTAPPHEALTAYGLLQFRDMAKVAQVDADMLKRTEKYLLDQRDGKGGFKRNPKGLDRFGNAPDQVTNAYIIWALSEGSTPDDLATELAVLRKVCKTSKDPYLLSLAALAHLNAKKHQEAVDILLSVRDAQKEDGQVAGAQISITGSQGHDLTVEATSLALLAYMKANRRDFDEGVVKGMRWLSKQRRGSGGFGGTQATILALKAMVAYQEREPKALQGGELQLLCRNNNAPAFAPQLQPGGINFNGKLEEDMGMTRATFPARTIEPITLSLREGRDVQPGKNQVQLSVSGNNVLPYTLTWSYRALKPTNDEKAPVKIAAKLARPQAKEGESVKLSATIENASGKGQGMTIAIVGLPGGLAIPEDSQQLKDLVKSETIAAWELRGRELVLYWRDLAPDAKISVELDLVCRLPGSYRGPASRAYLYYDADRKFWIEPLNIRIAAGE